MSVQVDRVDRVRSRGPAGDGRVPRDGRQLGRIEAPAVVDHLLGILRHGAVHSDDGDAESQRRRGGDDEVGGRGCRGRPRGRRRGRRRDGGPADGGGSPRIRVRQAEAKPADGYCTEQRRRADEQGFSSDGRQPCG
ncbi:hypothetical protein E3T54_01260 [Cryobacterium sp. Sr8]|nr:hypothetical protein E3T54_01260 [Cryobacterium sp. Sr8]